MGVPVQQLLTGMPRQRPQLSVAKDERGRLVVLAGRAVVLFGPFEPADLGARNLAIVALTQMGFGVGEVAQAFELQLGRVSGLRTAFRRHGSAGVVKKSGRPGPLDADAAARARWLIEAQGWTQQQVAVESVSPSRRSPRRWPVTPRPPTRPPRRPHPLRHNHS